MSIKQTLYPKTQRIGKAKTRIVITEKLDGSNLGIFKLNNNLIIAQRNWVHIWNPLETTLDKNNAYKGLIDWLDNHGETILNNLHEGSGVFGEWIGMGKINYQDRLDKKFYIFAKANIAFEDKFEVSNIHYDISLFKYPFLNQEIPGFMGVVEEVRQMDNQPSKETLDQLYIDYTAKVGPSVEGFIINNDNNIRKYVRLKGGVLQDHKGAKE